jgi:hypothetical protein
MAVQPKQFPSLQERENITVLSKFKKLYDNNQFSVLGLHQMIKKQYKDEKDIVYISHPIPSRISDFYGDFVGGDTDKMTFKADNDEEQKSSIALFTKTTSKRSSPTLQPPSQSLDIRGFTCGKTTRVSITSTRLLPTKCSHNQTAQS